MLVPFSWLKKHLDLTPEQMLILTPQKIAEVLTLAGLEVDKVEQTSLGFDGVVIAKVLKADPHPEAERLRIATVTDGSNAYQIVCGAPNCRENLVTALAKVGAHLTTNSGESFKIKKSKLRGVESEGMLCSSQELGLTSDDEGIIEFDPSLPLGTSLQSLYGDTIFEISLTPNLGHCLSIKGIARELCSLMNLKTHTLKPSLNEDPNLRTEDKITVTIEDQEKCLAYACRYLENVEVKPSPSWLKEKIEACGLRSINNIVDVTNYIMLEYGQPLHAFDYDKLEGQEIIVKSFNERIDLITLDQIERHIPPDSLLICDREKPLAVAGIIGGLSSSITDTTTRIILEAAYFDPSSTRKTTKQLHLRTDSSSRFEKNIDSEGVVFALNHAAALIQELTGATLACEPIYEKTKHIAPKILICRLEKINSLLGTHLSLSEVEGIFHRLRMQCSTNPDKKIFSLTIPSYRNDIKEEIDLIEEVARIYGYHNIDIIQPSCVNSTIPHSPLYLIEKNIRKRLVAEGLQEMITCNLISQNLAALSLETTSQQKSLIEVMHPSSVDQSILRPSMLGGLLQAIKHNFDHQNFSFSAFEIGSIHYQTEGKFLEKPCIGIVLTGDTSPHFWEEKTKQTDIFDLKGIIENLLEGLGVNTPSFAPSLISGLHPGRQGNIDTKKGFLGFFGEVHPTILTTLDIKQKVFFAQLDLLEILHQSERATIMKPLPMYPGSERDWTATFKENTPMSTILSSLEGLSSRILKKVFLLDIYRSDKLGHEKKNVTLRFIYRDDQKTIALETVDKEHARLLSMGEQKLKEYLIQNN